MIDWQQVILNIRSTGISMIKIARLVDSSGPTIGKLSRGYQQEPKFSTGIKLLDLHYDVCPDKHRSIKLCEKKH
jgi:hypothetical protein